MADRAQLLSLCAKCDAAGCRDVLAAVSAQQALLPAAEAREAQKRLLGECVVACADAAGPPPADRIEAVDTFLMAAADQTADQTPTVSALLADVVNYRRASDGRTMLLVCALQNRPWLIAHLVETYGAVLDPLLSTAELDESPLFVASRWHNLTCVEALLGHAPTAEAQANKRVEDGTGFTCLHLACFHGKRDLAALLLCDKNNADVHAADSRGDQALHLAARHGYASIIELLVRDAGASLHQVNHNKMRPVDIAIKAGKLECQLLLYEFMEAEVAQQKATSRKNALAPLPKPGGRRLRRTGRIIPPPPFSFSPEKAKRAYANTPFHFRSSAHDIVDDVRRDYLARWRKSYSMVWPESLLPGNQGEPETVAAQVEEFVHHTCRCLPDDKHGVWGQMRVAFFKAHHRAPFCSLEQACYFLDKLVVKARLVATGDEDSLRRQRERQSSPSSTSDRSRGAGAPHQGGRNP
jgi:hypothetical protein